MPRASRPFVLAFYLVSPFLLFYLNEARTYSMIFCFSAVADAAPLGWLDRGEDPLFSLTRWAWILSLSLVALTWTHVVGLVFELAVAIFGFYPHRLTRPAGKADLNLYRNTTSKRN